jgi:hypothetical protein
MPREVFMEKKIPEATILQYFDLQQMPAHLFLGPNQRRPGGGSHRPQYIQMPLSSCKSNRFKSAWTQTRLMAAGGLRIGGVTAGGVPKSFVSSGMSWDPYNDVKSKH